MNGIYECRLANIRDTNNHNKKCWLFRDCFLQFQLSKSKKLVNIIDHQWTLNYYRAKTTEYHLGKLRVKEQFIVVITFYRFHKMLKLWQNPDFIIKDAAIADKGMVAEILFFCLNTQESCVSLY